MLAFVSAIFCAIAILVTQFYYGGLLRPVFAMPGYVWVAVAGLVGVAASVRKGPRAARMECWLPVILLGTWLVYRSAMSPDPWLGAGYAREVVACGVIYLVFALVPMTPTAVWTFLGIIVAGALVQAVVGALQFAAITRGMPTPWFSGQLHVWYGRNVVSWKAHGFFFNGNHLAWVLNAASLFSLSFTCWGRGGAIVKLIAGWLTAGLFVGSAICVSRGGLLSLAVGLAAFCLLSGLTILIGLRGRRILAGMLVAVAVLVAAGSVAFLVSGNTMAQGRYRAMFEDSFRDELWLVGLRQAELSPLIGNGAGMFHHLFRRYTGAATLNDAIYAHNDWLQMLTDFGWVGFSLVVVCFAVHVFGATGEVRRRARERLDAGSSSNSAAALIGAVSVIVAFGAHSIFDFNMQLPANALLAAACFGLIVPRERGTRRNPPVLPRVGLGLLGVLAISLGVLVWRAWPSEQAFLRAENEHLRGHHGMAGVIAEGALTNDRNHSRLLRILGEAHLAMATKRIVPDEIVQVRSAAEALGEAARICPEDRTVRQLLAVALQMSANTGPGTEAIIRSIELQPWHGRGYELLAMALEREDPAAAARLYRISVGLPDANLWRKREGPLIEKVRIEGL